MSHKNQGIPDFAIAAVSCAYEMVGIQNHWFDIWYGWNDMVIHINMHFLNDHSCIGVI